MTDEVKHFLDTISISTTLMALLGWLPHIAAFLSVVWGVLRIYETKTVQRLIYGSKARTRASDKLSRNRDE